jgi:hypothetical protein
MDNTLQTASTPQEDPQVTKLKLEVENLKQQNEKISYEVDDLRSESPWAKHIRRLLPIFTGLVAVAGFWFGIIQYIRAEDASREARIEAEKNRKADEDKRLKQQADSEAARLEQQKETDKKALLDLKRETAKPLWDKQLSLYLEAAEKAAIIATSEDDKARAAAKARFWVLYWGPLAAVEDVGLTKQTKAEIEEKMVRFGELLEKKSEPPSPGDLQKACLNLAHAIRASIAPAFDVEATRLENLRKPLEQK